MSEGENHFYTRACCCAVRTYNVIFVSTCILIFSAMALRELQNEELSFLELLDGPVDAPTDTQFNFDYYTSNASMVHQDAILTSNWANETSMNLSQAMLPTVEQEISDTESLASCGTAVGSLGSPAVLDLNAETHFTFVPDQELKDISVKELNQKLKGMPKNVVYDVKKRRRTLKNRGYAHSCRVKRIAEKSNLQRSKHELEQIIADLQEQLEREKAEKNDYKNKYNSLITKLWQNGRVM